MGAQWSALAADRAVLPHGCAGACLSQIVINHGDGPCLSELFLNPFPGRWCLGNDVLTISYDDRTNIVRTVAEGLAVGAELKRYLVQLRDHVRYARAEKGRFLHLVDAANLAVQSRENFEYLAGLAKAHGQESDLNAVVVHSSLARIQLALVPTKACIRIFSDLNEAEAWLVAESQQEHAPGARCRL